MFTFARSARRALVLGAAASVLVAVPSVAGARASAPHRTTLSTHVVVIGASVTGLAHWALDRRIPKVTVDAVGGRSWLILGTDHKNTLWQAYQQYRPTLHAGDWLIIENERVDVTIATNRTYISKLIASLPKGVCLGWVLPHVYYATQGPALTAQAHVWNMKMADLIRAELGPMKCHAYVPWDAVVNSYTARTKGLTAAEKRVGAPLLYDGRHLTHLGQVVYANTIANVIGMPAYGHLK